VRTAALAAFNIMHVIDEYMGSIPPGRRPRIDKLIGGIRSWFPEASVSMKYKMPTFEMYGNWVAVANRKNYVSLYTCSEETIQPYIEKHPEVKHGKGCLNFRDRDEIDFPDLREVVVRALTMRGK